MKFRNITMNYLQWIDFNQKLPNMTPIMKTQRVETDSKWAQKLNVIEKDFKVPIINMFKRLQNIY